MCSAPCSVHIANNNDDSNDSNDHDGDGDVDGGRNNHQIHFGATVDAFNVSGLLLCFVSHLFTVSALVCTAFA